ncbi:MAG: pantetheine-phosphate adenylyltransferase [Candidatus Kapabacteria bacterium]|nr:pantetheine-phosphate adenylyltransferase [Candidatus Kapabacteria bacterium]
MSDRIAMYPGTFDPITNGHVDVIERAAQMFDHVIVVVSVNSKKTPLFSEDERVNMAVASLAHLANVSVEASHTLTVEFAREHKCSAIIRGVRAVSDFEYEYQIALMNRKLEPAVSTLFLLPHEKYSFLNSTIVRELARYGESMSDFVPAAVTTGLRAKFPDAYAAKEQAR